MVHLKLLLIKFFNISNSWILIIDELVSVFDKDNINIISEFIRKYYNNIILISHIFSFNDYISEFIKIEQNNNISYINF